MLNLVYGNNKVFKQKAEPFEKIDDEARKIADDMLVVLNREKAVGLGANMLGILKRVIVVDLCENNISKPYIFFNPEIIEYSQETQTHEEASLSFPGALAKITRPKKITVKYLDYDGTAAELVAEDFFAQVIQHEIDYLNGKIFLDYLSPMKKKMLLKKVEKILKLNPPHVHGNDCSHGCC